MRANTRLSIRRVLAGATSALLLAAGLTVVTETVAPLPASAAQNPTTCAGAVALTNGSFEAPVIPNAAFRLLAENLVPGWSTNDSLNQIEYWSSGFQGVQAAVGRQFAELNANSASTLFQEVATTPGQTLSWSLKHRGRSGTDVMRVVIGAPGGTLVQNGPNLSDGTGAWGTHTGTYTVPAGQTTTRFGFEAVSSAGGNASVGNFLDDITFGTGPCLITNKSVTNLTRGGTTAEVGDTLRYTVTTRNDGGNAALQSVSTDVLASGIDYVPGSISIISGAGTGALTDATADDRGEYAAGSRTVRVRLGDAGTATAGGSIGVGSSTSYTFDAKVNASAAAGVILNEAQVAFRDNVANQNRTSTSQETQTPVNPAADLAITKTLDTATLVAGRPATFTITVTNNGPQTATGVTVTDPVPAGLTNVTATSGGASCTVTGTITCAVPDMAVGQSVQIQVTGTVQATRDPGAALTNTATVTGTRTDTNPANNTATAIGTMATSADVSITKTFAPATPVAGQNVTYTLTASNAGPSEARDVVITDPLDPDTTFVSANIDQGTCAVQSGTVTCDVGTLAPGETAVATVVVQIAAGATAVVQNSATVTTSTSDPDPSNNVDSTSFQPDIIADLAVTKTASAAQVSAGDAIDFTLAVSNLGTADAVNAVLDDTLPAGFTVTGVDAPAGAVCTSTADSIRCTWASLPVGGPSNVVVSATVAADAPVGTVTNTASIASPAEDPNTANNSDSVDVDVVQSADLSVVKTAPTTGEPGSGFTYTLVVANGGPSVARGVTVSDVLPAGFSADSIDNAGCSLNGATVSCDLGDLAPGASVTVNIVGSWSAEATGTVSNTATTTSATPDPNPDDNTSTVEVTLEPSADVRVEKTTSTPSVPRGGEATFVVTVYNDGASAAAGIVVDEVAPIGLIITGATPSAGSWSAADSRWTVGTLLPGESATLTVTATGIAEGTLVNTATATSQTPDPDPSNNTGTSTVVVTPSADLSIVKTSSVTPAPLNGQVSYTLVVTNNGPSAASAVVVSDTLPAGLLNPVTSTPGCTITGSQLDCTQATLAAGGTLTVVVSGTVDPALADATLSNTATVTSDTPDPDPTDNTSTVTVPVSGTPRVELVKSVTAPTDSNADGRIGVGDAVAYTFTIRNTGAITLTSAAITDPLLGGPVACAAFAAPLAPGAEVTCAPVSYTLTQADIDRGTIRNEASVTAQSARGTATDDAAVTVTVPAVNSIALTKAPSTVADTNTSGQVDAGDSITYTFTVTNTGTTTLRDVQITDPMLGGTVLCTALDGVALEPGDAVTCAPVAYTLTQDDIDGGVVRNTATTTANAPIGTVTDSATASADLDQTAGIELIKNVGTVDDADGDGVIGAGDTVEYSFTVRNTGTTTLTGVSVSDPLLDDVALCDLGTLAPGDVADCGPFTYALTQADIENELVRNTATTDATSPLGAVDDEASADVVIEGVSALELTKTPGVPVDATGDGRIGAGDTVAFSFTVRNTGTTVLRDIVLDDPLLGGALDCPDLDGLELAPGAFAECGPVVYVLTQADIDAAVVRNTATATADSTLGAVDDDASAEVDVIGVSGITLTKTAGTVIDTVVDGRVGAGDTVGYTFTVRNTGTTALQDVVIDDPLLGGPLDCPTLDGVTLAPLAEIECGPVVYTLTQADIEAGVVLNTATATGDSVQGSVDDSDSEDVQIAGTSGIALTKVPGAVVDTVADGRTGAGDTVGYTFRVSNTGTVALQDIVIDDPLLGGAIDCPALDGLALAPGASVDCGPIVYTLTQADADAGTVHNEASVDAVSTLGDVTDDTEADVAVPGTNGISLGKAAGDVVDVDSDGAVGAGDTVSYTFTVTNTGTTTLSDARITDPMLGGAVDCAALVGVELAPGQTVTCAPIVYTLTQDDVDGGLVHNEATVVATAPRDATVDDTAEIDVNLDGSAGIEVIKSAGTVTDENSDGAVGEGDTVAYDFRVRNVGTTTLEDIVIDDPMLGGVIDCPALVGLVLAPQQEVACGPIEYTLTQADIENGVVSNTATAEGTSPLGPVDDDATVDVTIVGTSGIELTKTPDSVVDANGDGMIGAGDTVGYTFTIRNTGTTILRDIVIDDPLLGGALDCPTLDGLELDPQAEATCGPVQYTLVQGDITAGLVHNVATVVAQSEAGPADDSAEADVVVTGTDRISLLKSAAAIVDANGTGRTDAGDTIAYTFAVTNTGTTTLTTVAVSDPRLSGNITCDTIGLVPGQSTLCTGNPAVLTQAEIDAGEIVNTATATATGGDGDPVTSVSTVRTPIENQPAIALVKTGGDYVDENTNGKIDAGDSVAFRFTVTNTGARTLTDVVIDDPMLGGDIACVIPDLAPEDTAECGPVRYRLTDADAAAGVVVNVATVSGTAGAVVVTAAATASVDVTALAVTGGVITGIGWAAALLAVGALVLLITRVRRRDLEV